MDDKEALRSAILARPKDDAVRLVYADWLEENGDPIHAALIRVQCELASRKCKGARRKELRRQEAELLACPALHPEGIRWSYRRGFVLDGPELSAYRGIVSARVGHWPPFGMTTDNLYLLDRVLDLKLDLAEMDDEGVPSRRSPLRSACLRRVTSLECLSADPPVKWMDWLAACPDLWNVSSLSIHHATRVPLGAVSRLILSPCLPRLTDLYLNGEHWLEEPGDDPSCESDNPYVTAFVRRIEGSPVAERLGRVQLNTFCGPNIARTLIDAPHLRPGELHLIGGRGLQKGIKGQLRKRFGKALHLS